MCTSPHVGASKNIRTVFKKTIIYGTWFAYMYISEKAITTIYIDETTSTKPGVLRHMKYSSDLQSSLEI